MERISLVQSAGFPFDKQFSVVCLDFGETELQFSGNV